MDDLIIKIISRLCIPFIMLYGLYVVIHGSVSPGGGFAGGAILGAALVLYTLVFGLPRGKTKSPERFFNRKVPALWCFLFMALVAVTMGFDVQKSHELGKYADMVIKSELFSIVTIAIGLKVCISLISFFHLLIDEEKPDGTDH